MTDTARARARSAEMAPPALDVHPDPEEKAAVQDWEPDYAIGGPTSSGPAWDGRKTRLINAYPMMRDQQMLLPGDKFVVRASYDAASRRWLGPEGPHVEQLFAVGQIMGSEQAETRARLQSAIEHERGVHPTRDDPVGRPDLAPYTPEEVRRQWLRVLHGGQHEISRTERQNARSGDASVDALALQLATLLQGASQSAGSSAPGTAVVDQ